MGLWTSTSTAMNKLFINQSYMRPYKPGGISGQFRSEGLLGSMKRGVAEMIGIDNAGQGYISNAAGKSVSYGGGLLSGGGWREILHDIKPGAGGIYTAAGKRSLKGALGKFAGKAIFPAVFAYQAYTQGLGTATKDAVESGVIFGAARFAVKRLAFGLMNPLTLGTMALVGGVIGGRQALIAGRNYNSSLRNISMANPFNDRNGTAATMRQASLMAIQSSKINGRNSLGGEASLMHM